MSIDLERYYGESYPPSVWGGGGATVATLTPNTLGFDDVPTTITITGTGYTATSVVTVDSVDASTLSGFVVTFVDDTHMTLVVPTGGLNVGVVSVAVDGSAPRALTITPTVGETQTPTTESEYAMSDTPTEPDTPPEGEPETPTEPEAPST